MTEFLMVTWLFMLFLAWTLKAWLLLGLALFCLGTRLLAGEGWEP